MGWPAGDCKQYPMESLAVIAPLLKRYFIICDMLNKRLRFLRFVKR